MNWQLNQSDTHSSGRTTCIAQLEFRVRRCHRKANKRQDEKKRGCINKAKNLIKSQRKTVNEEEVNQCEINERNVSWDFNNDFLSCSCCVWNVFSAILSRLGQCSECECSARKVRKNSLKTSTGDSLEWNNGQSNCDQNELMALPSEQGRGVEGFFWV